MNCKHKNKMRLYARLPTTWSSRELWECQDCGAVLGIVEIKVKSLNIKPTLQEKTHDVLNVLDEVKDE